MLWTNPGEIAGNGVDDDCDGATDHAPECNGVVSENWCVNDFVLGICTEGFYSEIPCDDLGKVCSSNLLQCVDIECVGREDDRWCDDATAMVCAAGEVASTECPGDCLAGDCLPVGDSGEVVEPESSFEEEPTSPPKTSSCSTTGGIGEMFGGLGLLWAGLRTRRRSRKS